MSTEIIVAIIAALGAIAGSYFANQKSIAIIQEQIRETKTHITTLSSRVDKHNNLIERMAIVEQSVKSAHHRIDDFEK